MKAIRDADVNTRRTILFKSTQLLTYADDIGIMGRTTRNVQSPFIQIKQAARNLGLHINEGKTGSHTKTIKIENFYYLGSKITSNKSYDDEIRARLLAGNRAYFRLQKLETPHQKVKDLTVQNYDVASPYVFLGNLGS